VYFFTFFPLDVYGLFSYFLTKSKDEHTQGRNTSYNLVSLSSWAKRSGVEGSPRSDRKDLRSENRESSLSR